MSTTTYSQWGQTFSLNGNELILISQPQPNTFPVQWVSYVITTEILAAYINAGASLGVITNRQLRNALQAQGELLTVNDAVTADITTANNIAWNFGRTFSLTDPFVTGSPPNGFLQSTLGYSAGQMAALFELALTFPA